jgi:hypothetical protein
MHAAWIKIDESLPWIELKGSFETRADAEKAAKTCLGKTRVKIIAIPNDKK